jgi:hypothetical protein
VSAQGLDLERLLAGLAASLENSVLPHVDSHFAQLQIRAARELLSNVASRASWDREAGEDAIATATTAYAEIVALAPELEASAGGEGDRPAPGLVAARGRLGGLIDGVYRRLPEAEAREPVLEVIWKAVRAEYDAESARVRTGMFS